MELEPHRTATEVRDFTFRASVTFTCVGAAISKVNTRHLQHSQAWDIKVSSGPHSQPSDDLMCVALLSSI